MAIATALLALLFAAPPADEKPGYIGIQLAPLTAELRKAHKIADDVESGVVLIVVHDNTPASKAGLRKGDVLTSFSGKPIKTIEDLISLVRERKAGEKVAYVARRGSGTIAGLLVLGERPADEPREVVVEDEEPAKPAGGRKPAAEAELEAKAKALQAEMEELHRIARERAAAAQRKAGEMKRTAAEKERKASEAAPRRFDEWVRREERGLKQAEETKNIERMIWHKARLQLLQEMRETGWTRRAEPRADARAADRRIERLEKRLQQVTERLERMEERMK